MDITHYINHPEQLDKETLYDLRNLLALYPYHQPARLLMLKNLYLLHDPSFDEELRRAAIYITDRKTIFDIVEAAHYQLKHKEEPTTTANAEGGDRTIALIDTFLDSLPEDHEEKPKSTGERKPTAATMSATCLPRRAASPTRKKNSTR